jgi:hypothetical protein
MTDLLTEPITSPAGPFGDDSVHAPLVAPVKLTVDEYNGTIKALLRAATVAYDNRSHMTYTEGSLRWSGISEQRRSIDGQYPPFADCSAFVTWCYWDATRWLDLPDVLNGANWEAGYTGTLVEHGEHIEVGHTEPGDICLYGGTEWVPQHATMTIGGERVISFGHQGDPGVYPINLNGELPIVGIRRFLVKG